MKKRGSEKEEEMARERERCIGSICERKRERERYSESKTLYIPRDKEREGEEGRVRQLYTLRERQREGGRERYSESKYIYCERKKKRGRKKEIQ
jgi:hypothetical protein